MLSCSDVFDSVMVVVCVVLMFCVNMVVCGLGLIGWVVVVRCVWCDWLVDDDVCEDVVVMVSFFFLLKK